MAVLSRTAAVVVSAVAVVMVPMMAAVYVRIEPELSGQEILHRLVRAADDASEQADTGLCQRRLGTPADPAAEQRIHAMLLEKPSQCAMAAFAGFLDPGRQDPSVLHLVDFELLGMPEMLKDLTVFIRHRNVHPLSSPCFIWIRWFWQREHPQPGVGPAHIS